MENETWIKDLAVFLVAAGVAAPLFRALKQSAVLAFLLAGVLLGPFGLGRLVDSAPWLQWITVTDPHIVEPFGEAGVLFLLFMLMTAGTAIFIREINEGNFSWIHLFVPLTFYTGWQIVHFVRKGDIARHKRAVTGLFFGALLIPGLAAFLPGRTMWMIFFA